MKLKVLSLALLSCGFVTQPAISAQVPSDIKLAELQELVRGNGSELATIDPHIAAGLPEAHVLRDLFEGLVNQDAYGNIVPGVAESWSTTDGKTHIIKIRDSAKWSNGTPLTAEDFEYSFQRLVDPKTAAVYAWFVETMNIVNADKIMNGDLDPKELRVTAVDSHTLKIELNEPIPYFVKMLSHMALKPVHKETVEKYGNEWTKPEHFVSNGAYVLDEWVINERIDLVRNEHYWDDENTVIDKVTFLPLDSQVSEMNRFFSGEIDITHEVPLEHYKRLSKEHPNELATIPSMCTYFYAFNTQKAPFNDIRVRKALSYTIERDVISQAILGQGQKSAYFLTPEIVDGFGNEHPDYAHMSTQKRIEIAKKLLDDAGFNEQNPLNFSLLYNTNDNHKKIATAIQSMWKKSLSIVNVELVNKEWKTYLEDQQNGNFDVTRAGWCGDYNDSSTFLSVMQSGVVSNQPKFVNAQFDSIMQTAVKTMDDVQRVDLYNQAENILVSEMPIAPIYQYVQPRLIQPDVGGFPYNNALENIYSKDLYLKAQ